MTRIYVEIKPENLKYIRKLKKEKFIPIKVSVNEALDNLREKGKNGKSTNK